MKPLILGTRGSELALCQAEMVETALWAAHPLLQIERKIINTSGDNRTDLRFSEFAVGEHLDKGIFTKELELALESGEIDFAVHSLKDVPTVLDERFFIAAVLPRAAIEDVLISRDSHTLESLPKGAKIGTSSVRRIREIQWFRPDVQCVEIRGNVPTRLRKMFLPSELDAVLLAKAGLVRLGLLMRDEIKLDGQVLSAEVLSCETFLPAAGQGAVGIEARKNDTVTLEALSAINDPDTMARITAEREFLHLLKAGCQTPIGAHTSIEKGTLHMRVLVFDETDTSKAPLDLQASAPLTGPKSLAAALVAQMH